MVASNVRKVMLEYLGPLVFSFSLTKASTKSVVTSCFTLFAKSPDCRLKNNVKTITYVASLTLYQLLIQVLSCLSYQEEERISLSSLVRLFE